MRKYREYQIFHKGKLVETVWATNKTNALHFYGGFWDGTKKKDYTAERV